MGHASGRAWHPARRNQGRQLRLWCFLPRPGWNRARVVRAAGVTTTAQASPISMLTTPRRVDRVENSTPTAGSGWAGPDPLPCADPPVICGGCPVTYVTGGTCRRWVIPRPGDKRAGQGLSIRFGQAGSPTANELRHRLSPTHWPQLNTAYRTNETSSPQIRGVTAYTGIVPNPLRGNPR